MIKMYGVAQRDTIQLQSWKPQSHDFNFLHKPIVYGVAHLLYGVALSASVTIEASHSWLSILAQISSTASIEKKRDDYNDM